MALICQQVSEDGMSGHYSMPVSSESDLSDDEDIPDLLSSDEESETDSCTKSKILW